VGGCCLESKMTVLIRRKRSPEQDAIWCVHQAAFNGDAEAKLVRNLRQGGFVEVSLVAEAEGEIVGHILFSRITIKTNAGNVSALSLAPMAVLPSYQQQRIGSNLLKLGLATCRVFRHRIVLVPGSQKYFQHFGFSSELAQTLQSPFGSGETWMALELVPGALAGVEGIVKHSPPFDLFKREKAAYAEQKVRPHQGIR